MSTRLESYLSQLLSFTRNLVPSKQQLVDGVARSVAILLIYTITISTSVSLGAMPLALERNLGESARFGSRVPNLAGDQVARTHETQGPLAGVAEAHDTAISQTRQLVASASNGVQGSSQHAQVRSAQTQGTQPAAACLYALDSSAQQSFYVSGSTSISTSCSVVVESAASQSFYMSGTETLNLQSNAQVGVVGGYLLSGQTSIVNTTTGQKVTPVTITSPGDPFAFLPAPTQRTIVGKSHTSYDMNNKPANNTLSPGVYCGGLTIGKARRQPAIR